VSDVPPSLVVLAVIGAGVLLGWVVRLLVPASRRLPWSTVILVGVVGAAIAWIPLDMLVASPSGVTRLLVGLGGALALVAGASVVILARERRRARGAPGRTAAELIVAGEGERVELKSTARWNLRTGERDARLEDEIVVTVAAFMNASGGTLLIGVADDGAIVGLEHDYRVTARHNRDGFELWLREVLVARIGRAPTADVGVAFEALDGRDVCRVDVAPSDRPVFVRATGGARTADFHLRVGNSTRKLLTDEVLEYQARRWP
jgi:uncharacterized membrane protein YeaQ/YmgE (transglycosylase-associated protein family)